MAQLLAEKVDLEWRAHRLQQTLEGLAALTGFTPQDEVAMKRDGLQGLFDILSEEAEVIHKAVQSLGTP